MFGPNGSRLIPSGIVNPGGRSPISAGKDEGPSNVMDGDTTSAASKWIDINFGQEGNSTLVLTVDEPPVVLSYEFFMTNNARGRDPIIWDVYKGVDSRGWLLVDHRDVSGSLPRTEFGTYGVFTLSYLPPFPPPWPALPAQPPSQPPSLQPPVYPLVPSAPPPLPPATSPHLVVIEPPAQPRATPPAQPQEPAAPPPWLCLPSAPPPLVSVYLPLAPFGPTANGYRVSMTVTVGDPDGLDIESYKQNLGELLISDASTISVDFNAASTEVVTVIRIETSRSALSVFSTVSMLTLAQLSSLLGTAVVGVEQAVISTGILPPPSTPPPSPPPSPPFQPQQASTSSALPVRSDNKLPLFVLISSCAGVFLMLLLVIVAVVLCCRRQHAKRVHLLKRQGGPPTHCASSIRRESSKFPRAPSYPSKDVECVGLGPSQTPRPFAVMPNGGWNASYAPSSQSHALNGGSVTWPSLPAQPHAPSSIKQMCHDSSGLPENNSSGRASLISGRL